MAVDFRYRRLGYVVLNVTDMARANAFYTEILGLQQAGAALAGEHLFRCTHRHHDIVLNQCQAAGLRRVAWEMESDLDLESIAAHLRSLALEVIAVSAEECAALGIARAVRVTEPYTGACFEYFSGMVDAATPFAPTVANIVRVGHVVLTTNQHAAGERFFLDKLNFRASDRVDGAVTFMRCFPNPLHHSLGLSNAKDNHLHHVNFMVTDMDDIGRALYRLQKNNVPIVFGPGRHPPSGSVFLYFLDPDQITLEYSFGMEEFPEIAAREARRLPLSLESIDYWGAIPSPQFAARGVIEAMGS